MRLKIQNLEALANEAADILIPRFSAIYKLTIGKPKVKMPQRWRRETCDGYFVAHGKTGYIKLNSRECRRRGSCGRITAHEIGHSATWQHNRWYFDIPKSNPEKNIYNCLREGIAMEFEKEGIEELLKAGWLNNADAEKARGEARSIIAIGKDAYTIGYAIMRGLALKASMKEIIMSPERFFPEILEKHGDDIRKYGRGDRKV